MADSPVFTIDRQDLYGSWHSEDVVVVPPPSSSSKVATVVSVHHDTRSGDAYEQTTGMSDDKTSSSCESRSRSCCGLPSTAVKCLAVLATALLVVGLYLVYRNWQPSDDVDELFRANITQK